MAVPNTPNIYVPKTNDIGMNRNLFIVTDEYSAPPASPAFLSSDWQIATDVAFTNIVWQDLNSTNEWINQVNIENGVFSGSLINRRGLYWGESYYVRVRWTNADGNSNWSTAVYFTIVIGTNFVNYICGGASQPAFVIVTDEISFYETYGLRRNSTLFNNNEQGWYTLDIHDTNNPYIARSPHRFDQYVFRIPDTSASEAEYSYLDWTPDENDYGALIILWLKSSVNRTATIALCNSQDAFDPADCLILKKIDVTTQMQPYVLYYPRISNLWASNERRLWVFPTEIDQVTQTGQIDICRCIVRDVIEEIIMPVPIAFDIDYQDEYDGHYILIDGTERVYRKGFRLLTDIVYDYLSMANEINRRKIFNAERIFFFPHLDIDWCCEVSILDKYNVGYFADKIFHGHSGSIPVGSREIFTNKPKELIEV